MVVLGGVKTAGAIPRYDGGLIDTYDAIARVAISMGDMVRIRRMVEYIVELKAQTQPHGKEDPYCAQRYRHRVSI